MSSPKVASRIHRDDWDASPDNKRIRHGRQDLSPIPPPPAESIGETRRVVIKRKHDDPPTGGYAVRAMQDFLRTEGTNNDDAGSTPAKRPKSSVMVVSRPPVDRSTSCPILIRVFYSTDDRHTPSSAFSNGKYPPNEIQINAWMNSTFKEISRDIIFAVKLRPGERSQHSHLRLTQPIRLHFSSVFPANGHRGKYRKRDLGFCVIDDFVDEEDAAKVVVDDKDATLESKKFQVGDFLDVAISNVPERRNEDGVKRFRRGLDKKESGRF